MVSAKVEANANAKTETQTSSKNQSKIAAQAKTDAKIQSKASTATTANAKAETKAESGTEAQTDIQTDIESLSDDQMMVDNDAMISFSQAIQNGVNIMDLPEPNQAKPEPQLNDINTLFALQEHAEQVEQNNAPVEDVPKPKPQVVIEQPTIASMAAQMAQDQAQGLIEQQQAEQEEVPPSDAEVQAQSAMEDVKIVLPAGMEVRSHKEPEKEVEEDPDQIIKEMQDTNEAQHFKDPRKNIPLNEIQSEAQAAIDYVEIKDPFAVKQPKRKSHAEHIFDQQVQTAPALDYGSYTAAPVSLRASKLDNVMQEEGAPVTPSPKPEASHETQVEKSIREAEYSQADDKDQLLTSQSADSDIAGSNDMWGSQFEMEHLTGKSTRPADFKSPAQIQQAKRDAEKAEKQRIRMEILAPEPISEDDSRLYSDSLATRSGHSKSETQLRQEAQLAAAQKAKQDAADMKKLAEIQEQNKRLQKQMQEQEQAQIKQAELGRVTRKNNADIQSMQDLKALAQLQAPGTAQLTSLADQAAVDEQTRADEAAVQQGADAITQEATAQYEKSRPRPAPARTARTGVTTKGRKR